MDPDTESKGAKAAVGRSVALERCKAGEAIQVPGWEKHLRLIYCDQVALPGGFEPTEKWWQLDLNSGKAQPLPPGSSKLFDDDDEDAAKPYFVSTLAQVAREEAANTGAGVAVDAVGKAALSKGSGMAGMVAGKAGLIAVGAAAAGSLVVGGLTQVQHEKRQQQEIQALAGQAAPVTLAEQMAALTSTIQSSAQQAQQANEGALSAIGATAEMRAALEIEQSKNAQLEAELSNAQLQVEDLQAKSEADEEALLEVAEVNLRLQAENEVIGEKVLSQLGQVTAAVNQAQAKAENNQIPLPVQSAHELEQAADLLNLLTEVENNAEAARDAVQQGQLEARSENKALQAIQAMELQPLSPSNAILTPSK